MKKYETIKWLWQRISYWGDKLLTMIFYLFFGVFILSWRFIRWALTGLLASSKRLFRMLYSGYKDWRMGRRMKHDFKEYGVHGIPYNRLTGNKPGELEGSEKGEIKDE